MWIRLTSLNGGITLSAIAMLSFIGYALLEFRYSLEQSIPGIKAAALEMMFVLLLLAVGSWLFLLRMAEIGLPLSRPQS